MTLTQRRLIAALSLAALSWGCASAYKQGMKAGKKGDWDTAVARLTKAADKDPDDFKVRIALEQARVQASQLHYREARKHVAAEELEQAAEQLEIASKYDASNLSAAEDLRIVREKIRKRDEEKKRLSEFDSMRARAQAARVPAPVLSPRSPVPISMKYDDTSLEKVLVSLGKLAGVNVVFDEGFRDKRVNFSVTGVTFEEALEQLAFVNRLFYKVVDQNSIIIVAESAQKRRQYDDNFVQTFYLQNAEANETLALVTKLVGIQKVAANQNLGAITIVGTPDQLAFAEKVIEANDKAKGEVLVKVQIIEVNRQEVRRWGIELGSYEGSATFSPTGAANEVANNTTTVRAHLLSSLNLADFIVSLPSTVTARLLQTDNNARTLAAPTLRAAEGKKTELKIGTEVPIPVTTFTATQAGTSTFAPATSFQYRTVGVTLSMTPKVSAAGEISLEMTAEFSSRGQDQNVGTGQNPLNVPTFSTKNVNGTLRLRDGETSLLGGLLSSREADSIRGALGTLRIPVISNLLTGRTRDSDTQEILISITPYIVRGPKVTEEDMKTLNVGSIDLVRVPNARPPLFGGEEPAPPPSPSPSASVRPSPAQPIAATPPPTPAPSQPAQAAPAPPAASPGASAPSPSPAPTPALAAVSAVFRPALLSLRAGENGSVDLVVLGAQDLLAVDIAVGFDATLLEVVEATPGSLLTLGDVAIGAERNLEAGRARVRFTRPAPTSGAGAIASLKLKALRTGEGTLQVQAMTLIHSNGQTRSVTVAPGRVAVTAP
jgi:general secretion pathway protein D